MGELPAQRPDDVTIVDMEASIEHLTRGTVREVDALLVVAEPYYRALETAGRLVPLGRELGVERVWVVANKVRDARDEAAIRQYCAAREIEVVGVVPFDEAVTEADAEGRALLDCRPEAPAVVAITHLADTLEERLGRVPAGR